MGIKGNMGMIITKGKQKVLFNTFNNSVYILKNKKKPIRLKKLAISTLPECLGASDFLHAPACTPKKDCQ